jgi:hypothetical protein
MRFGGALPRFRLRKAYGATGREAVVNKALMLPCPCRSALGIVPIEDLAASLSCQPDALNPPSLNDRAEHWQGTQMGTSPCSPRPRDLSRRRPCEGGSEAALQGYLLP